jgi:hypothetical protein
MPVPVPVPVPLSITVEPVVVFPVALGVVVVVPDGLLVVVVCPVVALVPVVPDVPVFCAAATPKPSSTDAVIAKIRMMKLSPCEIHRSEVALEGYLAV